MSKSTEMCSETYIEKCIRRLRLRKPATTGRVDIEDIALFWKPIREIAFSSKCLGRLLCHLTYKYVIIDSRSDVVDLVSIVALLT